MLHSAWDAGRSCSSLRGSLLRPSGTRSRTLFRYCVPARYTRTCTEVNSAAALDTYALALVVPACTFGCPAAPLLPLCCVAATRGFVLPCAVRCVRPRLCRSGRAVLQGAESARRVAWRIAQTAHSIAGDVVHNTQQRPNGPEPGDGAGHTAGDSGRKSVLYVARQGSGTAPVANDGARDPRSLLCAAMERSHDAVNGANWADAGCGRALDLHAALPGNHCAALLATPTAIVGCACRDVRAPMQALRSPSGGMADTSRDRTATLSQCILTPFYVFARTRASGRSLRSSFPRRPTRHRIAESSHAALAAGLEYSWSSGRKSAGRSSVEPSLVIVYVRVHRPHHPLDDDDAAPLRSLCPPDLCRAHRLGIDTPSTRPAVFIRQRRRPLPHLGRIMPDWMGSRSAMRRWGGSIVSICSRCVGDPAGNCVCAVPSTRRPRRFPLLLSRPLYIVVAHHGRDSLLVFAAVHLHSSAAPLASRPPRHTNTMSAAGHISPALASSSARFRQHPQALRCTEEGDEPTACDASCSLSLPPPDELEAG
ncbi:hypothetical protein C8R45DRAFT_1099666 [Mycena sanguinolenta]|nr:hypothetical protein C8R45DRAFT_1099666 [Mycena sanguinolenta]